MKKESTIAYVLRLTVTLLLITACVAAALAGVNMITKDRIAEAKQQKTLAAMAQVLPGVEGLAPMELTGDTGMVTSVYASGDSYAVQVEPAGFNGKVTLMVGITAGEVQGISVISHTETPGLGAVAAADSAKGEAFRNQFVGLVAGIVVDGENNSIDSMSGATITSKAVTAGVNAALEFVASLG
jgi:electron transport complex protein RnfG